MKDLYRHHGGYQGPRAERLHERRRNPETDRAEDPAESRRYVSLKKEETDPEKKAERSYTKKPEIYTERQEDWGKSRKRDGVSKSKNTRKSPKVPSRHERYKTELRVTGRDGTENLESPESLFRRYDQNLRGEEAERPRSFLNSRTSRYDGTRAKRIEKSEIRKETEELYKDHLPTAAALEDAQILYREKPHKWGKRILAVCMIFLLFEAVMLGLVATHPEMKENLAWKLQDTIQMAKELTVRVTGQSKKETAASQETDAAGRETLTEAVEESASGNENRTGETLIESIGNTGSTEAGAIGTGVQEPINLIFAGDINLTDHVLNAYRHSRGIAGVVSPKFLSDIQRSDYFVANEEFPFSDGGTQAPDKQFTFRVAPENIKLFKDLGLDLVTLANNHALDYGDSALMDTIETLEKAGIRHIGAGKNLEEARKAVTVSIKGKTFAFIGATRVIPDASWAAGPQSSGMFSAYDEGVLLAEDIREAKKNADYVIVYLHWGEERKEMPNDVQKLLAHTAVDAGADLVVGAHPHVLQGIEYYKGVPVVYSLGNFIFGSSIPKTALLSVTIEQRDEADTNSKGKMILKLLPGTSSGGYTEDLVETEDRKAFYEYMASISSGITISNDGTVEPLTAK